MVNQRKPEVSHFLQQTILHPMFKIALEQMELVYETYGHQPAGMMLVGNTGLGKTSVLEYFRKQKYAEVTGDTDIPVLIVNTPAAATPKQVLLDAVEVLGGYPGKRPTEAELNRMMRKLLQNRKTRLVVFDEFQHLATSNGRTAIQIGNTIKNLMSDTKIPFALAGLPETKSILQRHPELQRRFTQTVELKPFTVGSDAGRKYFLSYLQAIEKVTEGMCRGIASQENIYRFWLATKGMLAGISRIIELAMRESDLEAGIKQGDLARAFQLFNPMASLDDQNPFLLSRGELLDAIGLKK